MAPHLIRGSTNKNGVQLASDETRWNCCQPEKTILTGLDRFSSPTCGGSFLCPQVYFARVFVSMNSAHCTLWTVQHMCASLSPSRFSKVQLLALQSSGTVARYALF